MSYSLERDQSNEEILIEKWIPFKPLSFETDEMPFRQEQLQIRTRECVQTLDLLSKLNEGSPIENILQPTAIDLAMFKVMIARRE